MAMGAWRSRTWPLHANARAGTADVSFYPKQKAVTSRWPTGIRAGAEFKMPTMG